MLIIHRNVWFWGLLLLMSSMVRAAGIDYVTVETQGSGDTESHAIASALSAAIAQVNGATMESEKVLAEAMVTVDTESESHALSASSTVEAVAQRTKGTVRDYRIISSSEESGLWTVRVESRIAKFERSGQSDRLRVSVLPFRVQRDELWGSAEQFARDLAAQLTQTRRFAVLDRDFEDERQSEMAINVSDDSPVEEMARLGNRLGTDLMVVGIVEDASTATRTTELAGRTLHTSTSRFAVNYRVIDAATGQLKFSDSWKNTREGSALSNLVEAAAESITRQIVDGIFPIAVESVSGDILFLGQGGGAIRRGQYYQLIQLGDPIYDRYTGESLGREEHDVGLIEIIDVQSKISKARIVKADLDVSEAFKTSSFVVRLVKDQPRSSTRSEPVKVQKPAKTEREIKEDLESSW